MKKILQLIYSIFFKAPYNKSKQFIDDVCQNEDMAFSIFKSIIINLYLFLKNIIINHILIPLILTYFITLILPHVLEFYLYNNQIPQSYMDAYSYSQHKIQMIVFGSFSSCRIVLMWLNKHIFTPIFDILPFEKILTIFEKYFPKKNN